MIKAQAFLLEDPGADMSATMESFGRASLEILCRQCLQNEVISGVEIDGELGVPSKAISRSSLSVRQKLLARQNWQLAGGFIKSSCPDMSLVNVYQDSDR